ncbi:hypothetical protein [Haloplasma contractile]|uniref:DUF308 domain-containing protein n=1 Tax=Haloplasma contractile SSD-17B TaxID=1033810 RepID=U2DZ75_9MOLU|nr:hypothetical protein [Haloplasma contractile]ERJ13507.1 hypothetical protein HLPCO_000158 [Haloplasma contractile SSD-17B]
MKNLRFNDYGWVVKGFTSIVLLASFIYMLYIQYTNEAVAESVLTPIIGITILLFTVVRIFPVLRSRSEKDYLLIMYSEILISIVIGALFIALPEFAYNNFSILLGIILYIRGCVFFFTTTKRYELSDALSFVINILFISFGFAFVFAWNDFTPDSLMYVLIALALIFSVYYGYGTYTGFNNTHLNRQNRLKMDDVLKKKEKEDDKVIQDPKHIEEKRNPKIIDEPKSDIRPTIEDERDSDVVS